MLGIFYLLILIVITVIIVRIKTAKENSDVAGIKSFHGIPQPIILKDNNVIIVQINFNYSAVDFKKVKESKKHNNDITRKLELMGIYFLRTYANEIENKESFKIGYNKIENDLTKFLIEEANKVGYEINGLFIKFGDKREFDDFFKKDVIE